MKRTIILVSVFAILMVGTLYSLPKIVVNTKDKGEVNEQSQAQVSENDKDVSVDNHVTSSLSTDQQKEVDQLRSKYNQTSSLEKANAAIQVSEAFGKFQKFDSSAFYAEQAAILNPTVETNLRAGDRYYEAYGFAVEDSKAKVLGEKTRSFYQKALDQNPALLSAKANMAMTYVNTASPMQGILLLREVLDTDPTNELALFNLGILSMRSNQYTKAVERFQQIIQNSPNNTKAQFYLGVCLVELGRNDEATKVLADVKKKEKDPVIQQAISELEKRLKN